jgi:hypothetical protein
LITASVALVVAIVFCASGVSGAAVGGTSNSKKVPVSYPTALTARLAKEYRDSTLASEVVANLSPALLADLEVKVPQAVIKTSPFLSYRPAKVVASAVNSLIVFEFGNRVATDGTISGGPTNDALAVTTEKFAKKNPNVPIFAQQQIAEVVQAAGVQNVTSINPVVGSNGQLIYLSTAGVIAQAVTDANSAGINLGQVGIIGFSDHASRCILTAEAAGLTAAVPKGIGPLPSTYDPGSGQSWTTNRLSYLEIDLLDRILTL